jgi:hypothetical protein
MLVLVGAAAVLTTADAAEHDASGVGIGEVTTRVVRTDVDLNAMLRSSLDHALHDMDAAHPTPEAKPRHAQRDVVLSLALQDMAVDPGAHSVTCSVSVALRTARGGAMFAVLEGRARVGIESSRAASVEVRAIDAAVRAAVARVPDALR